MLLLHAIGFWLRNPREAMCEFGIRGCRLHIESGWFPWWNRKALTRKQITVFGLFMAVGIIGIIVTMGGFTLGGAMFVETRKRGYVLAAAALVVVGIASSIIGFAQCDSISRQQCEEAGYEWITGTCYGSNVNLNEGR